MKIVIAPDSFKESLSALQVATIIEKGFKEVFPEAIYIKCPIADGGEGTVVTMIEATNGEIHHIDVIGPLGVPVKAFFGLSNNKKQGFIEMAAASGLELVPPALRNPLLTTSYGTGELITACLDIGVEHIIIGIGGSATNDGGAGMLQALGAKLLDIDGQQIKLGGSGLADLFNIDVNEMDPRLTHCQFSIACDVSNPLIGENGASVIFGPQKGATADHIKELDRNLEHFADTIKRDLGVDVHYIPGAGAAGGMGAALLAFLKAELRPGFDIIANTLNLELKMKGADLVITGEGRLDNQSLNGKVPIGVAQLAKKQKIPVIAIAGSLGDDLDHLQQYGIDSVFSILHKVSSLAEALSGAENNLYNCSKNVAYTLKLNLFKLGGDI
ncbi:MULTISPECIES: glycerate kinase [Providencia]|uniref:Glycerate kinase n=1 Tax=Providencia heimbachae ATCC 35613 TaxID=1354272 RepID=A0A1B7JWJ3_9GAMM|nr:MULTISPECIES: glycerate kinase [Providencia]MBP6122480.1 glycerate kinase [Providencia sp.]NIH24139.1 glycerate kinase [Providencia heimbachae]OAT52084.1 glycerate kinase [Providencia heimbachae ATCC 35613]SQH15155.1 Glycerate kinase [Providencia heimbachae]